ncbi:hypothetical protein [Virgibacillus indicus]|uniref:hypothetical protein n=1 Tax=Virgibacillus indicus TaxID=2024554 RepID=UPI0013FD55DB|nr:hypothetical protein [Virgibacillus indicus]
MYYYDKEVCKSLSEARIEQLKKMTYGKGILKKVSKNKSSRKVNGVKAVPSM